MDTEITRSHNRLAEIRDKFTCIELPDIEADKLEQIVQENEITDVIDLTNTACNAVAED